MLIGPAVAVGGRQRGARAPHQRRRARDELAHAERLRQVVVGAAVEPHHLVGFFAPRGQHQNRRVAIRAMPADRARDGDAVHARQHQIEDDEVEGLLARDQHRFLAIGDRHALVSLDAQVQTHQVANVLFVLDDEHFARFHRMRSADLQVGFQCPVYRF